MVTRFCLAPLPTKMNRHDLVAWIGVFFVIMVVGCVMYTQACIDYSQGQAP